MFGALKDVEISLKLITGESEGDIGRRESRELKMCDIGCELSYLTLKKEWMISDGINVKIFRLRNSTPSLLCIID